MSRGTVGLVLEAVFATFAFGARSYVQWRRTGSSGFIRPRRGAPAVELAGSWLFMSAIVLLVAGPVADLAGTTRFAVPAPVAVAGLVSAVAGTVFTLWAQVSMGDSWRIGVDQAQRTELVTDGAFAKVRNPIFSAMVLAAVGLAAWIPNWWSLAAVVVLVAGLELQVRAVEEPYLRRVHGPAYQRYLGRAGRFLPGIGTTA